MRGTGVPDGEIDRQYLDATAIREQLGWEPAIDLDDGLTRTLAWYRGQIEPTFGGKVLFNAGAGASVPGGTPADDPSNHALYAITVSDIDPAVNPPNTPAPRVCSEPLLPGNLPPIRGTAARPTGRCL